MLMIFWHVNDGNTLEDHMNTAGAVFFLIVGQLMNFYFGSLLVF